MSQDNRTSQAVNATLSWWNEKGPSAFMSDKRAIAMKYKRMEEALHRIATHFTHCDQYEMKPCDAEAKEALAYDPLAE